MSEYRKKPTELLRPLIVVDAEQFFVNLWPASSPEGVERREANETLENGETTGRGCEWFVIKTLEGELNVSDGDWIITDVKGERYPCKPDIFEATYEPVEAE